MAAIAGRLDHGHMRVRLARARDQLEPCCENIAIITQGKGPHAAALCCTDCWRHIAWLSKSTVDFLAEMVRLHGVPAEPFVLTDRTPDWGCRMKKSDAL